MAQPRPLDAFGSYSLKSSRPRSRTHKSVSTLTDTSLIHFEIYHERNRLKEELERLEKAMDPEDRCHQILKFINDRSTNDALLNINKPNPFSSKSRMNHKNKTNNSTTPRAHRKSSSSALSRPNVKGSKVPITLAFFTASTLVRMSDKQVRKICDVRVGDKVLSLNIHSNGSNHPTNTKSQPSTPFDSTKDDLAELENIPSPLTQTASNNPNNSNNSNNSNNNSNNSSNSPNVTFSSMAAMVKAKSEVFDKSEDVMNGTTNKKHGKHSNHKQKRREKPKSTKFARRSVNNSTQRRGLPAPNRAARLPQPYQRPMSARYQYGPQSPPGIPGLSHKTNKNRISQKHVGFAINSSTNDEYNIYDSAARQRTQSQFLQKKSQSLHKKPKNKNKNGSTSVTSTSTSSSNNNSNTSNNNNSNNVPNGLPSMRQRSQTAHSTKVTMGSMLPPPPTAITYTNGSSSNNSSNNSHNNNSKKKKPESPRTREIKRLYETDPQLFGLNNGYSNQSNASNNSDSSSDDTQLISNSLKNKRKSLQINQSTTTIVNGVAIERNNSNHKKTASGGGKGVSDEKDDILNKIDPNLPLTREQGLSSHSKSFSFNILPRLTDAVNGILSPTQESTQNLQSKSAESLVALERSDQANATANGTHSQVGWSVTANLKSLNESNEQVPSFDAYSPFSGSVRSHTSSVSSASLMPGISANGSSLRSSLSDMSSVKSAASGMSRSRSTHLPSVSTVGLYQIKRGSAMGVLSNSSNNNNNNNNNGSDLQTTKKSIESVTVTNTYEKMVYKLVTIVIENNGQIKCTPEQLFWIVGKGWGCADPKSRMLKGQSHHGNGDSFPTRESEFGSKSKSGGTMGMDMGGASGRRVRFNVSNSNNPAPTKILRSQSTVVSRRRNNYNNSNKNGKIQRPFHALHDGIHLLTVSGSRIKVKQIRIEDHPKGILVYCFSVNRNSTYFANDLLIKNYV